MNVYAMYMEVVQQPLVLQSLFWDMLIRDDFRKAGIPAHLSDFNMAILRQWCL